MLPTPRWGVGDALLGLLIANAAGLFVGAAILAATGYVQEGADGELPLTMIAVLQIPLWAGYLGMPLYAARRKGNGVVADFGFRMEWLDIPKGIGAGLARRSSSSPSSTPSCSASPTPWAGSSTTTCPPRPAT